MSELAEKINEAVLKEYRQSINDVPSFRNKRNIEAIDKTIDEHNQQEKALQALADQAQELNMGYGKPTGEAIERAIKFYNQFPIHESLKSLEEEETFIHRLMVEFKNSEMEREILSEGYCKRKANEQAQFWNDYRGDKTAFEIAEICLKAGMDIARNYLTHLNQ